MTARTSWGKTFQETLYKHLRAISTGACGARERPVVWGVTCNGVLVGDLTMAGFLAQARQILVKSTRVYRWENTVVYETLPGEERQLLLLSAACRPEPNAPALLNNLFVVGVRNEDSCSQSLVPARLSGALLADEDLAGDLPAIRFYARRPVFDGDFNLCGPGWHPAQGILVHGPDVTPARLTPPAPGGRSIDRLPPYLKRLLQDFCFASDADLENTLALLLTGLLHNHFVSDPKPLGLIDGNQQEIGKTLLCQAIGQTLDGVSLECIPLTNDEELEKKIGARLREPTSSIFFFDNVKARIDSAFIEANAPSPVLSVRLLGHSRNISRPNTYLWLITSNQTSGSSDMITRGLPIRLRYEGNPVNRTFREDLLRYAAKHRLDILGELAGMVERWKQAGRPDARDAWPAGRRPPRHRWQRWVEIVGGILAVNGLTSFLSNIEEARDAMDEGLQALATLAEHVASKGMRDFFDPPAGDPERGQLPRAWTQLFMDANVGRDKLAEKNARGRDTWVGTFLSGKTDRSVAITIGQHPATATLRRNPVRNDQKRYYFEVNGPVPPPAASHGVQHAGGESPPTAGVDCPTSASSSLRMIRLPRWPVRRFQPQSTNVLTFSSEPLSSARCTPSQASQAT